MKGKNIVMLVGSVIVILFMALYLSQYTGYYKPNSSKKSTLTDEAIKRFEEDVREGKEIDASNYLEKEKNYSNRASRLGMKLSKVVEKVFNKGMNALFKELEKTIQS